MKEQVAVITCIKLLAHWNGEKIVNYVTPKLWVTLTVALNFNLLESLQYTNLAVEFKMPPINQTKLSVLTTNLCLKNYTK